MCRATLGLLQCVSHTASLPRIPFPSSVGGLVTWAHHSLLKITGARQQPVTCPQQSAAALSQPLRALVSWPPLNALPISICHPQAGCQSRCLAWALAPAQASSAPHLTPDGISTLLQAGGLPSTPGCATASRSILHPATWRQRYPSISCNSAMKSARCTAVCLRNPLLLGYH
jgi:hypothetical protein